MNYNCEGVRRAVLPGLFPELIEQPEVLKTGGLVAVPDVLGPEVLGFPPLAGLLSKEGPLPPVLAAHGEAAFLVVAHVAEAVLQVPVQLGLLALGLLDERSAAATRLPTLAV